MKTEFARFAVWILIAGTFTGAQAGTLTRTLAFEYDPVSSLLVKEIIEPDNPNLCLVTTYTHDAYGNRTASTTRNCNGSSSEAAAPTGDAVFQSRTVNSGFAAGSVVIGGTTYSWSAGQFPTSNINALNHSETKEFDPRFGAPTKLTGPNGLVTTWAYDSFGRKASETRSDGTTTTWTYTRCVDSLGTCPTFGALFVTVASTGAPQSRSFFDGLNREIRAETQGFDGTWVRKDTQYDSLGRVAQVSKPYKASDAPVWATFSYDVLGRVTQANEPSVGSSAVRTATTFNGLVTAVTVSNAGSGTGMPGGVVQTKTTTKNSQGQVVAVIDTQNNAITYTYDPTGNVLTTNAGGVTTTLAYDVRGRKTSMADPDTGTWTYFYNALGELVRQADAKSQSTSMVYDKLGRMTSRTEPDLVSTWTYDSCTNGIGKLCSASSDNGYARTHSYDSLGRPTSLAVSVDATYTVNTTYVASGADTGKIDTLTYPTGFAVKNVYNSYGYLWKVQRTADADTTVYWQANSHNAAGGVTSELLGNGLTTTRTYDALFRVTAISSSNGGGAIHNFAYTFDAIGNVIQRQDLTQSVTENFAYDVLNRLTSASGPGLATRSFDYNAVGNMTYKSDVGTYTYPALTAARPHAVASVSGSGSPFSVTGAYTYDANGNLSAASGTLYPAVGSVTFSRTLTYTSYNMPSTLTHAQGGSTYSYTYTYNAEHERVKLVTVRPTDTLTSVYIHPAGKGALLYEKEMRASDGLIEHKHYVASGSGVVGIFVTKSAYGVGQGPEMRYYHRDHLDSIAAISNSSAGIIERLSFEAYGERRYPNGSAQDRTSPLVGITTDRGFTMHEHLDEMNLIHMNGRIYDPVLARFMTSDPFIAGTGNLQSYNRYSYVSNSPLMYTDPSGYWSLRRSLKASAPAAVGFMLGGGLPLLTGIPQIDMKIYFPAIAAQPGQEQIDKFMMNNRLAYMAGQYAATYFTAWCGGCGGAVYSAYYTWKATGSYDKAAKVGTITYATSYATSYIGANLSGAERVAASGVVGGVSAKLQGGSFEKGFMMSAASTAANMGYKEMVGRDINPGPGENRPGDPFYAPDADTGQQLPWDENRNVVGFNEGNPDRAFAQGGWGSRALNLVPGINATAGLHDYWFNMPDHPEFTTFNNVATMLPAAAVTYGGMMEGAPAVSAVTRPHRRVDSVQ
jgi:RHS repeat-associated protein